MSISIQKTALSHALIQQRAQISLYVPGESLAIETLRMGLESGRDTDKFESCAMPFDLVAVGEHNYAFVNKAVANIACEVCTLVRTGDHVTAILRVVEFRRNSAVRERNLLSVGPNTDGYEVLCAKGIHRIGVINR